MALVRVCDRCESDDVDETDTYNCSGVRSLDIVIPGQNLFPFMQVDLCAACRKKLMAFLEGKYSDENWEEEKAFKESKKEGEHESNPLHRIGYGRGDD